MNRGKLMEGLGEEIRALLLGYVAAQSVTDTEEEETAARFFTDYFAAVPYFAAHPELNGSIALREGCPGRSARFALCLGKSRDTVVLLHHFDVVPTDDYQSCRPLAYDPQALTAALRGQRQSLETEVRADLESGDFLFGHGVCDMKGGGAVQMALLRRLSGEGELPGSLLVLGVPDEENLSAGMRGAITALAQLKRQYGLRYRLAINSEPHQRREAAVGVFSVGSIGKLLPFVYVRGHMAHAGKVLEGLNPAGVMGEILCRTEACPAFTENGKAECAPPPTWLYVKDSKQSYDVSMPRSVFGCLNVLLLDLPAAEVMTRLRGVCEEAFAAALRRLEESRRVYDRRFGAHLWQHWQGEVLSFGELFTRAQRQAGAGFASRWTALTETQGESQAETHRRLVDFLLECLGDDEPRVIYGLMPPYYPAVCSERFPAPNVVPALVERLTAYARERWGQDYESERYFTGLSDLSYTSWQEEEGEAAALAEYMPQLGHGYDLPFEGMREIAMPCLNIGPWGKDFHKLTERVCLTDLLSRTPELLAEALRAVWEDAVEC